MKKVLLTVALLILVSGSMNSKTAYASQDINIDQILIEYEAQEVQNVYSYADLITVCYNAFMNYEGVAVCYYGSDFQKIDPDRVIQNVLKIDRPTIKDNAWLWGNMKSYKKGIKLYNDYTFIALKMNMKHTKSEMNTLETYLDKIVTNLDQQTANMTEKEKARVIYDYICNTFEYDYSYSNYDPFSGFYNEIGGKKVMVCQGYSLLYYYLCTSIGLNCQVVCSSSADHSLNIIEINGKNYFVDATWGDDSKNPDAYFLYSKSEISIDNTYIFYSNLASNYPETSFLDNLMGLLGNLDFVFVLIIVGFTSFLTVSVIEKVFSDMKKRSVYRHIHSLG